MRKFKKNYSKNLEKEVEERTKEIEEQKNNISNLLNYMSQSVFTIDAGGIIQSKALSKHSKKIFEKDIANCTIYDVLYPDIDKKSESYSLIVFAISTSLENNILQWEINKNEHCNAK